MRARVIIGFSVAFAIVLASTTCMPRRPSSRVKDMEAGHDKARWLAKTVRVLHYRRELQDLPNYQDLLNKSRADAVDALMADPLFADSVLDFGLFFLGFQPEALRQDDELRTYNLNDFAIGGFPQAIHAAQEVASGGDFFVLFDRWQPSYLGETNFDVNKTGLPSGISDADARGLHLKSAIENLKNLIDLLAVAATKDACEQINQATEKFDDALQRSGLDFSRFNRDLSLVGCFFSGGPLNFVQAKANKETQYKWLLELEKHREEWLASIKPAKNILEIPLLDDVFRVPGSSRMESFSTRFYLAKPNSSTNANRRRAAYVLNTFFCDDLTPLNVALPAAHAGQSAHGSDPACQACHFKLDPMAGFFRSRGINGFDFSGVPSFIFDDQKNISGDELTRYMNSWRETIPSEAARRPWRVGYVRSPDLSSARNAWGDSYDDLFKIIRDAPEVKQCLTRRMAEYYIGNNLIFDGAWIRQLTKKFDNVQGAASSAAYKAIVKDLVLSKTFTMDNPSPDQCYDYGVTGQPSSLPCKVADIVTRNCATCHSRTDGPGNLNIKSWSKGPDGAFSFEHNGEDGQRLPKNVSMGRIIERLSTADKLRLMPLNKLMPDVERATLYKWANEESRKPQ